MNQLLYYFKRNNITDTNIINSIIVSSFIKYNHLTVNRNSNILKYIVSKNGDSRLSSTFDIINQISLDNNPFGLEELIQSFEFVISPSTRVVTGAIYTPKHIRESIISYCLGGISNAFLSHSKVADISCGCGGFLMDAALFIHKRTGKSFAAIFKDNIYGIDIEDYSIERTKIVLSLVALLNGEDDVFDYNLMCEDTLNYFQASFDSRYKTFDYVIGNPPYVRSRNMSDETRDKLRDFKVCAYGHPDLYIPFVQIAIESLPERGCMGFITMNSFFNSLNGIGLRKYLQDRHLDVCIIDFRCSQVFKSKSTYTCLLFIKKESSACIQYAINEDKIVKDKLHFDQVPYANVDPNKGWNLNSNSLSSFLENRGIPLGEFCDSRHGIATLSNSTFIFTPIESGGAFYSLEKGGTKYLIEKGICRDIVNSNKLNSNSNFRSLLEKIIFPYEIDNEGKAIIISEEVIAQKYPKTYSYLLSQKSVLSKRDKGHTEKYPTWYAFGRTQSLVMPRYKLFFPKIANKRLKCVLADDDKLLLYNGMAFVSNTPHKLNVLKSIIESDYFWSYVCLNSKPYASGFFSLNGVNIKKFGIPKMTVVEEEKLVMIKNDATRQQLLLQLFGNQNVVNNNI